MNTLKKSLLVTSCLFGLTLATVSNFTTAPSLAVAPVFSGPIGAVPFVYTANTPIPQIESVGGPTYQALDFLTANVTVPAPVGMLMIHYSIPWVSNDTAQSRARILLEINGIVMCDATRYANNYDESQGINLNAIVTNFPGGTLSLRVLIKTNTGREWLNTVLSHTEGFSPAVFTTLNIVGLP